MDRGHPPVRQVTVVVVWLLILTRRQPDLRLLVLGGAVFVAELSMLRASH